MRDREHEKTHGQISGYLNTCICLLAKNNFNESSVWEGAGFKIHLSSQRLVFLNECATFQNLKVECLVDCFKQEICSKLFL
jgi:hypothetical protein